MEKILSRFDPVRGKPRRSGRGGCQRQRSVKMITVIVPPAPVDDRENALNALYAFVEGIGFDPAQVVDAYTNHEAFSLGMAVSATRAALKQALPNDVRQLFDYSCTSARGRVLLPALSPSP
jgi:hypothetical protein